jgi:hypothetical protein
LGGTFSLAMHFKGFLKWTGLVIIFIGGREQSWEHFAHQPCGRFIRLCISSLGCRNAGLHLLRMQEWYRSPWGMGDSLICLRSPDPTHSPLWDKHPTAFGERGNDSSSCFVLTMGQQGIGQRVLVSNIDPCSLQGPSIEWDRGLMCR